MLKSFRKVDELLSDAAVDPGDGLPSDFAARVGEKARFVRDLARAHWRVLLAGSVIALMGAVWIGGNFSREVENAPPSMEVFQMPGLPVPDSK